MVHECKVKFLVATFQRGSLHLYSGFHQECLKRSASWRGKLAGIAVDPLLGGPSSSEGWKTAERTSKDRDCEGKGEWDGRGFFSPLLLWTTGGLPGHLAAVAQRVRPGWGWGLGAGGAKVEHQHTVQPSLIPSLCRCRSVRHGQVLKGGEAESQLSLSFSHLSVHWLIVRVTAATFIISSTYLIRKIMAAPASRSIARWLMHFPTLV